jgi:hypothetical protein
MVVSVPGIAMVKIHVEVFCVELDTNVSEDFAASIFRSSETLVSYRHIKRRYNPIDLDLNIKFNFDSVDGRASCRTAAPSQCQAEWCLSKS